MTRCRDRIIERSKWLASVVLMSAAGAAVFGVAGADGRGGSHWANASTASAPVHIGHLASHFSAHVTVVRSHRIASSSQAAPAPLHIVRFTHTTSAATRPAVVQPTAVAHKAASTQATKRVRSATNDRFNTADTSTAGAASGTLGALAGADTQVTACPTDGSTQTTVTGAATQPTGATGSDTCSSDSTSGQSTGTAPTDTTTSPTGTTTSPTDTTTSPTDTTTNPTNNGQDNSASGTNGSGTDTSGSGTDGSGSGTDTTGSGSGSGSGTDTTGSGSTDPCVTQVPSGDGSQSTGTSGSNGTTDQLPETNPGVVCPGGSATPGAAGGSSSGSGSGSSASTGSGSTSTSSPSITALTNGATGSGTIPPATPLPTTGTAPSVGTPSTSTSTSTSNNNSSSSFSNSAPTLTSSGAGASVGNGAARTGAGATASLGGVNPAATALGLTGTGTGTGTSAGTGNGAGSHSTQRKHNSGGITDPISTVPVAAQALVKFVNHIPAWLWIALAALATVAAVSLGVAFRNGRRVRAQASAIAEVSAAALTDPLTGVLNRRGFTEAMERELARARRYGRPFVLAYVDVRGLKAVNDTEGHLAGDELLKSVAGLLHDSARADDVVGRLGGDELGLLLAEQSADSAHVLTDRIQSQLPERRAELGLATSWGLTIGTAAYPEDGETFNELLATADRRLYEKRGIELRREPVRGA